MGRRAGAQSSMIACRAGIRSATEQVTSKLWYLKKVGLSGLEGVSAAVVESDRGDSQHPGGRPGVARGGLRALSRVNGLPVEDARGLRYPI